MLMEPFRKDVVDIFKKGVVDTATIKKRRIEGRFALMHLKIDGTRKAEYSIVTL